MMPERGARSGPRSGPVIRIRANTSWEALDLREVWEYRELLFFFVWRDIKVRYKQAALGALWAVLQPFGTMVVFSLFFGRLAGMPSDGVPYPIFAYSALVPWTFFANAISQTSNSLVGSANLIKKVYFPRLAVPIASALSGLVDFGVSFTILLALMYFYGIFPTVQVVWLPVFILLVLISALGVGLWLSALNVQFRDVRYMVPFIIQFWMFATPIVYPGSLLSDSWRIVYALNPMVGVVEGFRWSLLGSNTPPGLMFLASWVVAVAILISGAYYFRQMERRFADVV